MKNWLDKHGVTEYVAGICKWYPIGVAFSWIDGIWRNTTLWGFFGYSLLFAFGAWFLRVIGTGVLSVEKEKKWGPYIALAVELVAVWFIYETLTGK